MKNNQLATTEKISTQSWRCYFRSVNFNAKRHLAFVTVFVSFSERATVLVRSQSKVVRLFRIVSFLILHRAQTEADEMLTKKISQEFSNNCRKSRSTVSLTTNSSTVSRRSPIESARREKKAFMLVFQCVIKNLFLFSRIELFFQVFLHSLYFLRPISCIKEKRKKNVSLLRFRDYLVC